MGERPSPDLDRVTVSEAAATLGISQDAVRKRIARGTIPHDRDETGRVYVYLSPSETVHKTDQDTGQDAYIRSLEDQIAFLRQQLERRDAILLNLTERIPELEARESPVSPAEASEGAEDPRSATGGEHAATERPERGEEPRRRSWWREFFGY